MKISLHLSTPHDCGYFTDRQASTLFLDPKEKVNSPTYGELLNIGFRRSGKLIYRPHCQKCNQCIPLRISTAKFKLSRSQKRILNKNKSVRFQLLNCGFSEKHYKLYKQYLKSRHPNGDMEKHTKLDYFESMIASEVQTMIIEFHLKQQLVAVSITDVLNNGLSAVYTFFDPELSKTNSLGTFAILKQIELAKSMNRSWLYLGYWIKNSQKMAYKSNFTAAQILTNNEWKEL